MTKLTAQDIAEIKYFILNDQIRPRLLCNLYKIDRQTLQELIEECK